MIDEASAALRALAGELPEVPGTIRLERRGPVAVVTIDNPTARNALSVGMMATLAELTTELERSDASAWLLRGVGPSFCAGGHLGQVRAGLHHPERGAVMARAMTQVLDRLLDLPFPGVAVVGGAAVGGGVELATACDFRVGEAGTSFDLAQGRLGVAAGWGGVGRLVRCVGRARALRWCLDARAVGADEALASGLLDEVAADPEATAATWVEGWASLGPVARAFKRQVVDPASADVAFAELWGGPLHRARLRLDP